MFRDELPLHCTASFAVAADMPMQFEVNGLHPAGEMSSLGAAAAALPDRSPSSQYSSKFSLVVTIGSMMSTEHQSVPCKLFHVLWEYLL